MSKKPIRNMKAKEEVKGASPIAYETHPKPGSGGAQKARGTTECYKAKMGKIPNK